VVVWDRITAKGTAFWILPTECVFCLGMTGEVLKLTHVARGLDAEGTLLVDIVINGFVPPMLLTSNLNLQVSLSHSRM